MIGRLPCLALTAFACLAGVGSAAEPLHPIAADVASQLPVADQPFVMVVEFLTKPAAADALIDAMADPTAQTLKEPGNLAYDLSRQTKDPRRFVLYEHWKDIAALDAHLRQPYLTKLLKDFDAVLAEPPTVRVYVPVARD